jgi:hypothetical protein
LGEGTEEVQQRGSDEHSQTLIDTLSGDPVASCLTQLQARVEELSEQYEEGNKNVLAALREVKAMLQRQPLWGGLFRRRPAKVPGEDSDALADT